MHMRFHRLITACGMLTDGLEFPEAKSKFEDLTAFDRLDIGRLFYDAKTLSTSHINLQSARSTATYHGIETSRCSTLTLGFGNETQRVYLIGRCKTAQ